VGKLFMDGFVWCNVSVVVVMGLSYRGVQDPCIVEIISLLVRVWTGGSSCWCM